MLGLVFILLVGLAIKLIQLIVILFAFADFGILLFFSMRFITGLWSLHTVFYILIAVAIVVAYILILNIPVIKYILPIGIIGFVSYDVISFINTDVREVPFDSVWLWALKIVLFLFLISVRQTYWQKINPQGSSE